MTTPLYKHVLRVLLPLVLAAALTAAALGRLAERPDPDGLPDGVYINELCAKNLTGLTDADGSAEDWVELINLSDTDVVLDGWGLSDDPDKPFKWGFPQGTTLPAGANNILLVFADGQSGMDAAGNLHADFRLSRGGETLVLTAPDGTTVDELSYGTQEYDLSYGRLGGDVTRTGVLTAPTPGRPNATDFLQETVPDADLGQIEFSARAGFYEEDFSLTLSTGDADALILYTLDGSLPTVGSAPYTRPISIKSRVGESNRYVNLPSVLQAESWLLNYAYRYAPDPVDKATTVTARLYKDGVLGDEVFTRTYWVGVDPFTLPVVSLSADADDLFGAQGIYLPGETYYTLRKYDSDQILGNFNGDEKVDGRLQILDGDEHWSALTTVRVSGGWSRQGALLKNLHLKLQDDAASDFLSAAPGGDALDTLVLRGSGNGTVYPALHQDAFLCNYLYGQDIGTQFNEPVVLFLQDEYWGVYTIRESKNTDFFWRHYGIKEKDLICPGTTDDETAQPEKSAFGLGVDAMDAATPEGMAWAEANLDIDEYIRYIIAQMYVYNSDGLYNGGNNSILWKSAAIDPDNPYADGRWRFLLNDLDCTLIDVNVDPFAYLLSEDFSFAAREFSPWYSVVDNLFQKLWRNPDFRARFAREFTEEMTTLYAPENILPAFEAWTDRLAPEIGRDLARQQVDTTALAPLARALGFEVNAWQRTTDQWQQDVDKVRDYFSRRAGIMLDYLDQYLREAKEYEA